MSDPHPHDVLRARAGYGRDAVDMWAVEEIDRLTEALAAAKQEAADNAEDRDGYARSLNAGARETAGLNDALAAAQRERDDNAADAAIWRGRCADVTTRFAGATATPSPLVALASAMAVGLAGSLVAWLPQEKSTAPMRVDTAATADNVLAVARAILGAT